MLETRASRTWFNSSQGPSSFLGSQQTELVHQALLQGGALADVDTLVVCSPVPLAFLSPASTNSLKNTVEDFKGLWAAFEADLSDFITKLHNWKVFVHTRDLVVGTHELRWQCARPGRELVITAGDVHLATHTDIFKNGQFVCPQLTSSAIHNERLGWHSYAD